MQHWILRCKHCNKEYTYCTYGNGPEYGTEEGCSQEYCAECQKAINEALSKIPVKFREELVEIDGSELQETFNNIKEAHIENIAFPNIVSCGFDSTDYDITEIYQYKNKRYEVKWNEETPEDKHTFVVKEYDIINKKVTKKEWRYEGPDRYSRRENLMKSFINARAKKLDMPTGELLYMDFGNKQ